MLTNNAPNILEHDDYRDFLAARFRHLKSVKKNFSYAIAARKTNVAQSYYKNLFRKDRHLGLENLGRVSKTLELNITEEFFLLFKLVSLLVQDTQSFDICRKNLDAITTELKLQHKRDTIIPKEGLELDKDINPLYFYAILHLCDWPNFSPTVEWVRSRLFINDLTDDELQKHILKATELRNSLKEEQIQLGKFRDAPLAQGLSVRKKPSFHSILQEILKIEGYHTKVHNYAEHRQVLNLPQEGVKELADYFFEVREKLEHIQKKYADSPSTRTLFWDHSLYNLARELENNQ
ncbi:hypothetical protein [Bdellovibrio sp. HCB-162]|uniref:hypothetical protein n=1 Tax=Bdellovibrio sp. HCB-162 TaxID=3394234 RepID=UPI0039BD62F1